MQPQRIGHLQLSDVTRTRALGAALAPLLNAGDTLLLHGDIGAGKSVLSRAIIQTRLAAENRMEEVPSPTFTLVQIYDCAGTEIWHCDLYRLTSADEAFELGLDDAFETAICLIEWPDRLDGHAPPTALHISLQTTLSDESRRDAVFASNHPSWAPRLSGLLQGATP